MKTAMLPLLAACLLAAPARAADWPQFQGPNRDSISPAKGLLKEWPKDGPPLAWTFKDAGTGYSSPAVVGDRLYIMGARDDTTYLLALDTKEGKELWKAKVGPAYTFKGNTWGVGPRATPTVADGLIYALGGFGDLVCVDKDGKEVWRKQMAKDLQGDVNNIGGSPEKLGWGHTWSPLVDGDLLICYPGGAKGAVAALDRKTGAVKWRSEDLTWKASYASPIVADVGGVRQYIVVANEGLAGVAAKDGELLWTYEKKYYDVVIPTPIYHNGHVYHSGAWKKRTTCDLIQLVPAAGGKFTARKVYSNRVMKNSVGGSVLVGGHVYGHSDRSGWVCQDFLSGEEVWAKDEIGTGSLIYADGHLYLYGEDEGVVALVEASPKGWKEKGRFKLPEKTKLRAPSGRNWTPPVIADGKLYVRDQELLFCYKIK